MWIRRETWEQQVINLAVAKVDAQAAARLAELKAQTLEEEIGSLKLRIKELKGHVADLGQQLLASRAMSDLPPIEAEWFEEDEEEVRKDRLRIEREGTSDGLIAESG